MFDRYIETYGTRLYALCLKLCKSVWEAQDLYQETWLRAYRAYGRYDPQKEFFGWLTTICVNLYRDGLRKKKLRSWFTFQTGEEQQRFFNALPAREEEDWGYVRAAVDSLPDKLRLVIILYYFNDQNIGQVAAALHIPTGTVKTRLSRARELLKERFLEDG